MKTRAILRYSGPTMQGQYRSIEEFSSIKECHKKFKELKRCEDVCDIYIFVLVEHYSDAE